MENISLQLQRNMSLNMELKKFNAHYDSSDNQISEARIQTIFHLKEFYFESFKFSIETSLQDFKPMITKKYESDFKRDSKNTQ